MDITVSSGYHTHSTMPDDFDFATFAAIFAQDIVHDLADLDTIFAQDIVHDLDDPTAPAPKKRLLDFDSKKINFAAGPATRKERIERFHTKRKQRVWTKNTQYDVRKNFANSRMRVKGRFITKEEEEAMLYMQLRLV